MTPDSPPPDPNQLFLEDSSWDSYDPWEYYNSEFDTCQFPECSDYTTDFEYGEWDPLYGWRYLDDDLNPYLTDFLMAHRYIRGRLPIRKDENPRGKYPRKPLPWGRKKLSNVIDWNVEIDRKQPWYGQQYAKLGFGVTNENTTDKPHGTNKPHYLAAFDAISKRRAETSYFICCNNCNYCPKLVRGWKAKQRKSWLPRAIADGVEEIANEMYTDSREFDYMDDDGTSGPFYIAMDDISMDDIVREREEPVYVVRYRPGRRGKGGGKVKQLEVAKERRSEGDDGILAGTHGDLLVHAEEEWEYLNEGWDSESCDSIWVEVEGYSLEDSDELQTSY